MPKPIVIYYQTPSRPFTKEEIAAQFAKLGKDSPIIAALRQIIQERNAEVMATIGDPRVGPEALTRAAGRMEELLSLHGEIVGYVE